MTYGRAIARLSEAYESGKVPRDIPRDRAVAYLRKERLRQDPSKEDINSSRDNNPRASDIEEIVKLEE